MAKDTIEITTENSEAAVDTTAKKTVEKTVEKKVELATYPIEMLEFKTFFHGGVIYTFNKGEKKNVTKEIKAILIASDSAKAL